MVYLVPIHRVSRKSILILSLVLLAACLISTDNAQGLTINGDWIVSNTTIIANETIIINNGIIRIEDNANLTLINSTLIFGTDAHYITIGYDASLNILHGSSITWSEAPPDIYAYDNSVIKIIDSNISINMLYEYVSYANTSTLIIDNATCTAQGISGSRTHLWINNSTLFSPITVYYGTLYMNNTIVVNTDLFGGTTLRIEQSNNTLIENSNITGFLTVVEISESSNVTIRNTYISSTIETYGEGGGSVGVYITRSSNVTISDSTIKVSFAAISITYSSNITVIDNVFIKGGIYAESSEWNTLVIENNTIGGRAVKYIHGEANTTITGSYGELIIANSTNLVLEDLDIKDSSPGLLLTDTNNTMIRDSVFENTGFAILSENINNVTIAGNMFENGFQSMQIYDTNNLSIRDIIIKNHTIGLEIYYTNNAVIRNISMENIGVEAISISRSSLELRDSKFINCTGKSYSGVESTGTAIAIGSYSDVYLENVLIKDYKDYGINIYTSYSTIVINKTTITGNTSYGIYFWSCSSSQILISSSNIVNTGDYNIYSYGTYYSLQNSTLANSQNAAYLYGGIATFRYNKLLSGDLTARWGGTLDARWNWWGTGNETMIESRLHEITDPGGRVGRILYKPWLQGEALGGFGKVNGNDEIRIGDIGIEYENAVNAELGAARYVSHTLPVLEGMLAIYDVYLADASTVSQIIVKVYYDDEALRDAMIDESSLSLYWWDGASWQQFSDTGVNTTGDYVWAIITTESSPNLTQLSGTPIALSGNPMAPVGGEIAWGHQQQTGVLVASLIVVIVLTLAVARKSLKLYSS